MGLTGGDHKAIAGPKFLDFVTKGKTEPATFDICRLHVRVIMQGTNGA
jgi:hypothetical protein